MLLQIGALRDLKRDMGVRRNVLLKAVVAELERRVYQTAIGEASDSSSDEDETPELSATLVMDEVCDRTATDRMERHGYIFSHRLQTSTKRLSCCESSDCKCASSLECDLCIVSRGAPHKKEHTDLQETLISIIP